MRQTEWNSSRVPPLWFCYVHNLKNVYGLLPNPQPQLPYSGLAANTVWFMTCIWQLVAGYTVQVFKQACNNKLLVQNGISQKKMVKGVCPGYKAPVICLTESRGYVDSMTHASMTSDGELFHSDVTGSPAPFQRMFGSMHSMSTPSPLVNTDRYLHQLPNKTSRFLLIRNIK